MASSSENFNAEAWITLDGKARKDLQYEFAALQQENEQLKHELAEFKQFHERVIFQQRKDLEDQFSARIKELFEKVAELQAVLDNSPVVIYMKDRQGKFILVNRQFETLFHLTKEQIQGKSNHEVFPKELADAFWENDRQVLSLGVALRFEEAALQDDGLHTYLSLKFPLFNAAGVPYAVCGISTDISETKRDEAIRKQSEELLRQQQQRERVILDVIASTIWVKDTQNRILRVNQAAAQAIGLPIEAIEGKSIYDLFPEEANQFYQDDLEVIQSGQPKLGIVEQLQTASGEKCWVHTDKVPFRDEVGRIAGVVAIATDITELKRTQEALQQSQQLLQFVLDTIPQRIFYKDLNHYYLGCNRAFAQDAGLESPEEIVGKRDVDFSWKALAPLFEKEDRKIIESDTPKVNFEEQKINQDGSIQWLRTTKIPLHDENRKVIGIFGCYEDITDRKRAEEARFRLAAIVESSDDAIISKDLNGIIVSWNSGAEQMFGYPAEEVIGQPISLLIPDDRLKEETKILKRLKRGQRIDHFETIRKRKNGTLIDLSLTISPIKDATGTIIGVSKIARDISDQQEALRKRQFAEQALAESEAKFRRLVEDANDLIFSLTVAGLFIYLSPKFTDLFGYDASEFLGQPFIPLVHPDDLLICVASNQRLLETGEKQSGVEFRHKRKDGNWCWVTVNTSPIRNTVGEIIGIQGILRDISDRKQEEQRAETQYTITRILSEASHLSEVVPKILQTICDSLEWSISEFWSIDSSVNVLKCIETWYSSEVEKPQFAAATEAITFTLGIGLPGRVWESREPLWISNVVDDLTFLRAKAAVQEGLHGACAFPIMSDQEVFGVITFFSQKVQAQIDQDWLKVMMAIGRQIGQFIKRKQAEQQSQQRAENLKQTLRELRKTQSQLIQTEKMSSLGQLVAGVAHEINNPVNFIHGNLEPIRQYAQDLLKLVDLYQTQVFDVPASIREHIETIDLEFIQDDFPRVLTSIQVGTNRIRGIVQSLRTFSRLDEAEVKAVDLHEGIDSTLMILGNRLKTKAGRSEIHVIKEYGFLPQVECYAGQLNQVFMNVLCNAIDALEEGIQSGLSFSTENVRANQGGMDCESSLSSITQKKKENQKAVPTIRIRTEVVDAQGVRITFSDNGPGIPPSVCQRIFDPFFTTKPVGKGTGMGMSISYQIITETHRGNLKCNSCLGQGAEFVIEIPIQQ